MHFILRYQVINFYMVLLNIEDNERVQSVCLSYFVLLYYNIIIAMVAIEQFRTSTVRHSFCTSSFFHPAVLKHRHSPETPNPMS